MKKNNCASDQLSLILKQTQKLLKINRDQNEPQIIFDMLSAVDEATFLLQDAWKVGMLHNLADDKLRKEFTDMLLQLQEIKTDISGDLKYKH